MERSMLKTQARMALLCLIIIQCIVFNVAAAIKVGTASFKEGSEDTRDFLAIPPFLKQAAGKPSVILAFDISGSMLNAAYESKALRQLATGFDAKGEGSYGYFDADKQYRYDVSLGIFFEDRTLSQGDVLAWDGGFLNWLTMRRIDVARKSMVGGKVRQREGELIKGSKMWVLEGEIEFNPSDTLTFQDPESARYSPILNHAIITVDKGRIKVAPEGIAPQLASVAGFNIKLAVSEEPKGLIQKNRLGINFGLSVYNFDHKLTTETEIINDNRVDGQTMHPCYPLFDAERLMARRSEDLSDSNMEFKRVSLYNGLMRDYLCVPTGVHAPNEKIVQVIEEYPLIWGTTPIAEGMVDIGNYIRQDAPHYSSGNDPYGVYGVDGGYQDNGFRWDPYYDAEQGAVLSCKKVFILHFNDGVSNADYDALEGLAKHLKSLPYYQEIPGDLHTGANESLDSVALALRKNDCRSTDLGGTQNIVSYYVYAALGDDDSKSTSLRRMMEAAARGGFIDDRRVSNGTVGLPDPMWPIDTNGREYADFYSYSKLNSSECPNSEWDSNGDCVPDTFYLAEDIDDVLRSLQSTLTDILSRSSSGGAASVISASSSAEGVVYQASFSPSVTIGNETVKWVGDVSALMIDQQGRMRSDDGDGRLESTVVDPIYSSCYDVINDTVRVKLSTDEALSSTRPIEEECTEGSGFISTLNDVGYLWRANSVLSSLSDTEAATQRTTYASASKNRYIRTNISLDTTRDGAKAVIEQDFVPATFTEDLVGLLNTRTQPEAAAVVNFIRGVDQAGMRSRQLNNATQRLGDIIYSSPAAVGAPSENLHLINGDASYWDFYTHYKSRRTIIYVGGNDGMLHAFNGGWYDKKNRQLSAVKPGFTAWALGQETWGFVPYNLLPHLIYLSKSEYGLKAGDHAYFVDQAPYVFDAQIFGKGGVVGQADTGSGSTHPKGWGTVLVVGFRSGGGLSEIYPDPSDTASSVTIRPAYLIFDITDPEQPPKLLAEFAHEKLGASMSTPTALTVKSSNGTDWYLVFGSGPSPNSKGHRLVVSEQNAHLLMFNLKKLSLENGFGNAGVMDLGESNAFVGDIVAVDIDMDATTDSAYFGTVSAVNTDINSTNANVAGSVDTWGGKLFRLRIDAGTGAGNHHWKTDLMFDARAPISTRPNISFDKNKNRWIHVGTGRFYTEDDLKSDAPNLMLGLKEPRNAQGIFAMDTYSATPSVIRSDALVDVSNASITESSGQLNNSIKLSPSLEMDTVGALEARQMKYNNPSSYLSGWKTTLQEGERVMGGGSVLGGVFSQTTYKPEQALCSVFGESYLYALRYTTGTAWYKHIFEDPDFGNNNDAVIEKVQLGVSPSLSPGIHLGENRAEGEATIINLNSDQSISINIEHNLEDIMSKEVGWRQL
ncbi:MAG: type IV pilus assembly protein PilY1 [Oleiphilaceae bacterium]|jgi:type IV pilus assembly protein PilY1